MSQQFLLKTPELSTATKPDNAKELKQSNKQQNADEPSFSSALEKQIKQGESKTTNKKDAIDQSENSVKQPEKSVKQSDNEKVDDVNNEESGNFLPEKTELITDNTISTTVDVSEVTEITEQDDLVDTDSDVSAITVLKSEIEPQSSTKLASIEQLAVTKPVAGEKAAQPSLNKQPKSTILGGVSDALIKGENADSLQLDKKPQTTNLRSDIFHALSKNKASETVNLDELVNKTLLNKVTEKSSAPNFSSTHTSASSPNLIVAQNASATPAQPVLAVQPSIQSSAWNQVISSRVVWMAREGIQEASLKLNPANLGPVDVKLNMHHDQANVLFIAQHHATRDALEQALPRLRESFEENGMQLADAGVSEHGFEQDGNEDSNGEGNSQQPGSSIHSHSEGENVNITSVEHETELGLSIYA